MKKQIVILFPFLLFSSCAIFSKGVPKEIESEFTQCYNGEETYIRDLINIDGYYRQMSVDPISGDTTYSGFMFFDDGIFVNSRSAEKEFNNKIQTEEFFHNVIGKDSLGMNNQFYDSSVFRWGHYTMSGDTIKVQFIYKPFRSLNDFWHARSIGYKVIDRNTLLPLYSYPIGLNRTDRKNYETNKLYDKTEVAFYPARFIRTSLIPSSDNWMKEEKWFWCNEEDWKAYMDRIKERRRKK